MTVENAETGITTNRRLRNFDAALEESPLIGSVVSDAENGEVGVTASKDGAVEEGKRLAAEFGFSVRVKEADGVYARRMFFEIEHPTDNL